MKISHTILTGIISGILSALPALGLVRVPVFPDDEDYKKLTEKIDGLLPISTLPGTDFYFGSCKEKQFILLDTGSDQSFVQDGSEIETSGYASRASITLNRLGGDFYVKYADGNEFWGDWCTEEVAFDHEYEQLANLTLALVYGATDQFNVFGLGYNSAVSPESEDTFFINNLFKEQLISRRLFSVYRNDEFTGEFIFGGIDSAKFKGELMAVPIIGEEGWWIKLFDLSHGDDSLTNGNTYPILIDTGFGSGLRLPGDVFNKLVHELDAIYEPKHDDYIFQCNKSQSLFLNFGGFDIEIPSSSFAQEIIGTEYCTLRFRVKTQNRSQYGWEYMDKFILGWAFFDHFYFVFDVDKREVLIGTPIGNEYGESVIEINDTVPNSVKAPLYSESATATTNTIEHTTVKTVKLFTTSMSIGGFYGST